MKRVWDAAHVMRKQLRLPRASPVRTRRIFLREESRRFLDEIREASLCASALKQEINRMDEPGREAALLELERLRRLRAELEKERLAASEERMRLFGHL